MRAIDYFDRGHDRNPDRLAIIDTETGLELTFAQTKELSERIAAALQRAGFENQDLLGLYGPNDGMLLVVLLAIGVKLSIFTIILGHVLICTPYAVAILSRHGITDIGLQMLAAIGATVIFATLTGAIALRIAISEPPESGCVRHVATARTVPGCSRPRTPAGLNCPVSDPAASAQTIAGR